LAGVTSTGDLEDRVGVQLRALGYDDAAWDVAVQSDGKIVLAGDGVDDAGHFRTDLMRFDADGNADFTFGSEGKVRTPFDGSSAYSVAVQPDGKIVVGGTQHDNFVVKRLLANGKPDVTFGCLGTTDADFGGYDAAYEIALQPDGRILAVGSAYGRNGTDVEDFALARFERDGGPGACGYELDGQGGLHRFGIGNPAAPPAASGAAFWSGKDVARGVAVSPTAGGVVVDITGALHPFAIAGVTGKPVVGSAGAMPRPNLARGVAMLPNGKGGYVLDGWGGMHPFAIGNNPKPPAVASPSWTNWNIARGVTILPDGTGGYIVDAWGGLHPFAIGTNARPPAASGGYWKGWDIARGVTVLADGTGGYLVDGWGGMHAFAIGNNPRPPAATAGYWKGWDIARGVAALP
jgi:uncharacterized delta-60 repeat protein